MLTPAQIKSRREQSELRKLQLENTLLKDKLVLVRKITADLVRLIANNIGIGYTERAELLAAARELEKDL